MLLTAHSGANGTAPNAEEFFDAMRTVNADVIEVDIRRIWRDYYLTHDRVASPKKKGVLPLSYAFDFIKRYDFLINCDLKKEGYMAYVMDMAERMGVKDRIILTGSTCAFFDLKAVRFGDIYVNSEYLPKLTVENVPKIKKRLKELGPNVKGINISYRKMPDRFFYACSEENVPVSLFTVDDEESIKKYVQFPCIVNLTTRSADQALRILGREVTK